MEVVVRVEDYLAEAALEADSLVVVSAEASEEADSLVEVLVVVGN